MTLSNFRLHKSLVDFSDTKEDSASVLSGILGLNSSTVQVPNREGFVYVRLRDNLHEVIEAYNGVVSPVYNLPVLIKWDKTRYMVVGRDLERYVSWGTTSPYLPLHGASHSFSESGAGDVVWVFSRQFMPWLITPSGSSAAASGMVQGYPYYFESEWKYLTTTGTPSLVGNQPTGSSGARMSLLYLDQKENIVKVTSGTEEFDSSLTGTADVVPYIPGVAQDWHIPLAGVRTVTGTATIGWSNLYDLRPHFTSPPTGTGGGGASFEGFSDGSVVFVETEQAQEDNSNFYYDDSNNVLYLGGAGTPTPVLPSNTKQIIQGDGGTGLEVRVGSDSAYPYLITSRARGTLASPAAVQSGDILSRINHYGYDGSSYVDKARHDVYATENWSTNARGTKIQVRTTPTGTAGTSAVAEWNGTGLDLLKGIQFNDVYITGTASYVLEGDDTFLWCDAADTDDVEVELPTATNDGQFIAVKLLFDPSDEGGAVVTIDPKSGEYIDSVLEDTVTISEKNDVVGFIADGEGQWNRIFSYVAEGVLWSRAASIITPATSGDGVKISVPTTSRESLVLQTSDDNNTKNIQENRNSLGNSLSGFDSRGVVFSHGNFGDTPITNVFMGYNAGGISATTGNNNVGIGLNALSSMTEAESNFSLGSNTLINLTTGTSNVAIGTAALRVCTGQDNVGLGTSALLAYTGNQNVAIGTSALQTTVTGTSNVAIGYLAALYTTGDNNVAVGASTLRNTSTGRYNVAIGSLAIHTNSTGDHNVGIGYLAGLSLTGSENTAIGSTALQVTSSGQYNTAVGKAALILNTSGNYNIALGRNAGLLQNTGSNNIYIGSNVYGVAGESNKFRLHNGTSNPTYPLIYGEFDTRTVRIHGDLEVSNSTGSIKHYINSATSVIFNEQGDNIDLRVEGDSDTNLLLVDAGLDRVGIGIASAGHLGKLHVDQHETGGGEPVIVVDQADISEEFLRFIGSAAAATLTQSIVAEGDVTTATRQGWLKIYVRDDGNQITDQAYYVPIFTLA